jgi:hypothetical protein
MRLMRPHDLGAHLGSGVPVRPKAPSAPSSRLALHASVYPPGRGAVSVEARCQPVALRAHPRRPHGGLDVRSRTRNRTREPAKHGHHHDAGDSHSHQPQSAKEHASCDGPHGHLASVGHASVMPAAGVGRKAGSDGSEPAWPLRPKGTDARLRTRARELQRPAVPAPVDVRAGSILASGWTTPGGARSAGRAAGSRGAALRRGPHRGFKVAAEACGRLAAGAKSARPSASLAPR